MNSSEGATPVLILHRKMSTKIGRSFISSQFATNKYRMQCCVYILTDNTSAISQSRTASKFLKDLSQISM